MKPESLMEMLWHFKGTAWGQLSEEAQHELVEIMAKANELEKWADNLYS